jgi:phosphonopyruvate decarboxylase
MDNIASLAQALLKRGLSHFFGVPDSTLEPLLAQLKKAQTGQIEVAANEAHAVAQAAGYFMASGKIPVVFLQNSGLGNIVNPYTSLVGPGMFDIPILFLVGWRGHSSQIDEPQHALMGAITASLLDLLKIPHFTVTRENFEETIEFIDDNVVKPGKSAALLVPQGIFSKTSIDLESPTLKLTRYGALQEIARMLPADTAIVATTGMTSRELFQIRLERREAHACDLNVVGGMGSCASIALGIVQGRPTQRVCILDGDGAIRMQMGNLASLGGSERNRVLHIIFSNGVHDSTGGQNIAAPNLDYLLLAEAFHYRHFFVAKSHYDLELFFRGPTVWDGPGMLIVEIQPGSLPGLKRPNIHPFENCQNFSANLQRSDLAMASNETR